MSSNERPRVLILGGGFAGVGAAQKLKEADADVVLVDRHDYHTFQPLLYQLATGLLETTAVGHSLRDLLVASRQHDGPQGAGDRRSTSSSERSSFDEIEPISYDYLVFGLGAEVNFFGTAGAPDHAFPMYTLPHAVQLQGSPARALGGGRPRSEPDRRTARSTSSSSAAVRPASRRPARSPSSIAATSRRTTHAWTRRTRE